MFSSASVDESYRLFRAKLIPPAPIPQPLLRERLFSKLSAAWKRNVTVITAPAGYGKTSLLQSWADNQRFNVRWLRLDADDNELRRFLFYFVHTLPFPSEDEQSSWARRIMDTDSERLPLELEPIAAQWIAVLDRIEKQHLIVMDGFESIRNASIVRFLTLFFRYSPPHLHVILSGREVADTGIRPTEIDETGYIDAEDLALTDKELYAYLFQRTSVRLTESEIGDLMQRSQGWFVGANAYLSLVRNQGYRSGDPHYHGQARQETTAYFRHLIRTEGTPDLLAALLHLSVARQPDETLAKLLTETINPALTLAQLAWEGWFLFPARHQPGQFQFHPMFADFLQRELRESSGETYSALMWKCAIHMEETGQIFKAIEHLQDGGYRRQAADLLFKYAAELMRDSNLKLQLERFTEAELTERPGLAVMYANKLIHARRINAAEHVVNLLNEVVAEDPDILFPPTGERLNGYLASLRSMIHFSRRETDLGLKYMIRAADELGGPGKLHRHALYFHPHTASLLRGKYGHYGVLQSARVTCEYCIPRWGRQDTAFAVMLVCMGECCYEEGMLMQAEEHLRAGLQLGLDLNKPGLFVPAYLAWAQLKYSKGEKEAAWAALREARNQLIPLQLGEGLAVVDACEAKLRIEEQDIRHVRQWMKTASIRSLPSVPPDRMFEAFVLLRAYLFIGKTSEALTLGETLLHASLLVNHPKDLIEAHLLLARIHRMQGEEERALEKLNRALSEAHAQGYVQMINDEGSALTDLLLDHNKRNRQQNNRELDAFASTLLQKMRIPKEGKERTANAALTAILTRQEQRVFQLLIEGASNRTIADVLAITTETAKKHCRHVYRKLGVANRKQAIEQYARLNN
ncbi:LuxR C-terminal-related transcriptional regulator [Paenibacillus cymbidii]|uniref:LuxR C-terminal-related transcriptional regulator n=1 Tax=Paenibacillus cymbidii TaxID=1639034 RepID=UPI00107FD8BC|nr:LuxR C-terminal-related transcriptional regulator [Paenibacillus cymbidii]